MNRDFIISFLLIAAIPLYLLRFTIVGVPTTLFELQVWLVFIYLLIFDFKRVKDVIFNLPILTKVGLLLFLIGSVIGVAISPDTTISLGQFKGFILTPLVASFVWATLFSVRGIIYGLLVAGLSVALSGLVQLVDSSEILRITGIFALEEGASPNYLAFFLVPITVISYFLLIKKKYYRRYQLVLLTAILFLSLVLSGSRAAIAVVVLLIAILTLDFLRNKYNFSKWLYRSTVIAVIIFAFGGFLYYGLPDLSASPDSGRVATSNNIRYEIWKTTLQEIIPSNLMAGVGLGNYQNYFAGLTEGRVNYPEFITPRALMPHNLVLSLIVNSGILGLIGFLLIVISVYRAIPSFSFWTIGLTSLLLLGILDTPFYKNDLSTLMFIFSITSVSIALRHGKIKKDEL